MKLNNFAILVVFFYVMGCSKSDDTERLVINDDDNDEVVDENGGDGETNSEETSILYTATTALKDASTFKIGNIVSASKLSSNASNDSFKLVLNAEFNSITAENDMKMNAMFPAAGTYDWSRGDVIVAYAKANGIRVHGHALIWHPSYAVPDWLENFTGTDEAFETHIENYIKATVAHFAEATFSDGTSVVASWDVVNEAFTEGGYKGVFSKRLGADYVAKCFQWAREADANVKLFYNDYSLESSGSKVQQVVAMVNDFQSRNPQIPIDGIGSQMHINYKSPDLNTIKENTNALVKTGLLVHISELDMSVNRDAVLTDLTLERAIAQKKHYYDIVMYYKSIPSNQQFGITLWGMRDSDSWLLPFHNNNNEWPLLFDDAYNYKIAHKGFAEALVKAN